MGRIRGWSAAAAALVTVVVAGQGTLPGVRAEAGHQGLVRGGPPPDLFLVYTGDVIGYVDPCG